MATLQSLIQLVVLVGSGPATERVDSTTHTSPEWELIVCVGSVSALSLDILIATGPMRDSGDVSLVGRIGDVLGKDGFLSHFAGAWGQ